MKTRLWLIFRLALVTTAVLLAPLAPTPFSFWLALAAALLGPGMGIPQLLFPSDMLSLPETVLITGIASSFLETTILAMVNACGVLLSPLLISVAILAPMYVFVLAALLRERLYAYPAVEGAVQVERPAWLPFCCGVALAAVVSGGVIHMLGI
jgi:hypothetical protein